MDGPAGEFRGIGPYRVRDCGYGNGKRGQPSEIERHAHFRLRQRPDFRVAHAGHAVELVRQVVRQVFQHAVRRRFRNERDLHDIRERGSELVDVEAANAGGKRWAQRIYLAHDVVVFLVGIGRPVELDRDHGKPVFGAAFQFLQVVEPVHRVLDGADDELFDVGRVGAGKRHIDDGEGSLQFGVFGAGNRVEGIEAYRRQHGEDDERELPVADGKSGNVAQDHGWAISGAVAASAALRSLTTRIFAPGRR